MNLDTVSWPMFGILVTVFLVSLGIVTYLKNYKGVLVHPVLPAIVFSFGVGLIVFLVQQNIIKMVLLLGLAYWMKTFYKR
jgi:hypothetical protein